MATNDISSGMLNLLDASGKVRNGWGYMDMPPQPPIQDTGGEKMPSFGEDTLPPGQPSVPTTLGPGQALPSQPSPAVTTTQPPAVTYSDPPAPIDKVIEVAGTGMGASQPYSMLESEAMAVYSELKAHKTLPFPALIADLAKDYGIDATLTNVGHKALVNKATGDIIAVDTNGNGVLDMSDMNYAAALQSAGINPNDIPPAGQTGGLAQLNAIDAIIKALDVAGKQKTAQTTKAAQPASTTGTPGTTGAASAASTVTVASTAGIAAAAS